MARQIVPVSDVASILLTQDEGDLRYLPITYSPPPVDLSLYYTKVQSDALFQPAGSYSLTSHLHTGVYQPVGSYALTTHNHDAAYQPIGDYALRVHDHDATYLKLSGGTLTGALTGTDITGNFLNTTGQVRFNTSTTMGMEGTNFVFRDAQSRNRMVAWDAGNTSFSGDISAAAGSFSGAIYGSTTMNTGTFTCRDTIYCTNWIQTGSGANYMWVTPTGIRKEGANALEIYSGAGQNIQLNPTGTIIHPPGDNGVHLGWPGLRWASVRTLIVETDAVSAGGQLSMNAGGNGRVVITKGGSGSIYLRGGYIFADMVDTLGLIPERGNNLNRLGDANHKWIDVWAQNGSIQTSHSTVKKNLALLDPKTCTDAVLGTDWVAFEYLPTPPPERKEGETNTERMAVLDDYTAKMQETAFSRRQNGYVLGHEVHKTHLLFGLGDRMHSSPSADLGILACALQAALQRIAALESLQGVTA